MLYFHHVTYSKVYAGMVPGQYILTDGGVLERFCRGLQRAASDVQTRIKNAERQKNRAELSNTNNVRHTMENDNHTMKE